MTKLKLIKFITKKFVTFIKINNLHKLTYKCIIENINKKKQCGKMTPAFDTFIF